MQLPKIIWIYWLQGESSAPTVVRRCIDSWRKLNIGWRVTVIDASTYMEYVNPNTLPACFDNLGIPMRSDLLRLSLLLQYGGVWVDATTLCVQPLDNFIYTYTAATGFFIFSRQRSERVIASWFMAAMPAHPMIRKLRSRMFNYFSLYPVIALVSKHSKLEKICRQVFRLHPQFTRIWLIPIVARLSVAYPYFLLHYQFYDLLATDMEFRSLWRTTPRIFPAGLKFLLKKAQSQALTSSSEYSMSLSSIYLLKLSHKSSKFKDVIPGSSLDFIYRYIDRL